MTAVKREPTTLYRAYAEGDDRPLYIGIARSWPRRWTQHSEQAPWFPRVTRIALERHPDRSVALTAERAAIKAERPRHNIVHNDGSSTAAVPRPEWSSTSTMRPLNFGVHAEGRTPDSYGRYHWAIGLPDGREVYVDADAIDVLPTGALRCMGAFRRMTDVVPEQDPTPTLILPAGAWVHAYAASGIDGAPVAVSYLSSPET